MSPTGHYETLFALKNPTTVDTSTPSTKHGTESRNTLNFNMYNDESGRALTLEKHVNVFKGPIRTELRGTLRTDETMSIGVALVDKFVCNFCGDLEAMTGTEDPTLKGEILPETMIKMVSSIKCKSEEYEALLKSLLPHYGKATDKTTARNVCEAFMVIIKRNITNEFQNRVLVMYPQKSFKAITAEHRMEKVEEDKAEKAVKAEKRKSDAAASSSTPKASKVPKMNDTAAGPSDKNVEGAGMSSGSV